MSDKQSLAEAMELLTIGEIETIERHYEGKPFPNGLSPMSLTASVIWALERRRALRENAPKLPDWSDVSKWTLSRIGEYFADEELEIDPSEPETDEGKEGSPDA